MRFGVHKYKRGTLSRREEDLLLGDSAALVSKGTPVQLGRILDFVKAAQKEAKFYTNIAEQTFESTLVQHVEADIAEHLLELICEVQGFKESAINCIGFIPPGFAVDVVNSGLAASVGIPNAVDSLIIGKESPSTATLGMNKDTRRVGQKIVASIKYYGYPRNDNFLIEYDDNFSSEVAVKLQGRYAVAVAKAIMCIRMKATSENPTALDEEFVFLQYDAPDVEDVDTPIEQKLGCVRLKWAANVHDSKYFDLVPISSVRSKVQIIRGDIGLNLLHNHTARATFNITSATSGTSSTHSGSVPGKEHWQEEFFSVN